MVKLPSPAQSLFHRSPVALSMIRWSNIPFVHSAFSYSSWTFLILFLGAHSCSIACLRSCSLSDLRRDCLVATSLWDEIWFHSFQKFNSLASPTSQSFILLKCDDANLQLHVIFLFFAKNIFKRSVSKNIVAGKKIPSEHSDIIFIKIVKHLEKL